MDIYDSIPKSTVAFSDVVVYPFNIDTYIDITIKKTLADYKLIYNERYTEEKMEKLYKTLDEEKKIYKSTAYELMNRYSSEFMIISRDNEFHKMSKYAVDNFVYILRIRGWNVDVYYGIYKDAQDESNEYYVRFNISPFFTSKL